MFEATFRVAGDSPYAAATAGADAAITLWCTDHRDLLRVGAAAAVPGGERRDPDRATRTRADAVAAVREAVGVAAETASGGDHFLVTEACLRESIEGVEAPVAAAGCVVIPPIRYVDGARVVRVLALDGDDLADAYHALAERFDVNVLAKRESGPPPASGSPVAPRVTLTSRQREVFRAAYDGGYYDRPRGVRVSDVADAIGIDRRTAEEHLRKAEEKLLTAAVDAGFA